MSKISTKSIKTSALDSFSLSFEYDMSWHEAKKSIKLRSAS